MINFGLYLLSFAANTLVVLTAPAALLRDYVLAYNAASVVFSLLFFAYFSRFATISRSIVVVSLLLVGIVALGVGVGWYEACILLYPGLLILSDYIVTQSHNIRVVTGFRVVMVISAAPFIIMPESFSINLAIRVAFLLLLSVVLALTARESHLLSVKSPIRYQIGNYLFYNGTLSLMAFVVPAPSLLRWWYIATQVALVLVLKVLDYSLRRAYSLDVTTRRLAVTAAGSVPVAAFLLHPNIAALVLAYVGFFGLVMTGRYISR